MVFGMIGFFFLFLGIPILILILILWIVSRDKFFGQLLGLICLGLVGFALLVNILNFFSNKKELAQEDIYGEYVIDRTKFAGRQANWQYDHYKFEITKQNQILFHILDKGLIKKTIQGKISFIEAYKVPVIALQVPIPKHHILKENPTLYRHHKKFYYVFKSTEFGNVFFRKGTWVERKGNK